MKIIVTGGYGQLGRSLKREIESKDDISTLFIDKDDLDLTDPVAAMNFFQSNPCDVIVNCAAFTAVDKAETEQEAAKAVNSDAVKNLALAAVKNGCKILHVSTDYVFDGESKTPYKETDTPNPHTIYGTTKLAGEIVLKKLYPEAIILRTAWLYSEFGTNFFLTIKKKGENNEKIRVVKDQFGTPTYAADLARVILQIILGNKWKPGIYHYTDEGMGSWYDFAREIYTNMGLDAALITPVATSEYPCKAERPKYSVLDKTKIKETFKIEIPQWQESLKELFHK